VARQEIEKHLRLLFIERAAPLSDKRGVNCGWARIGNWPGYKTIFTTSIGGDP